MVGIERWNIIFLLPPSMYFDGGMEDLMKLLGECTWLWGTCTFHVETMSTYLLDFTKGGRVVLSIKLIGDVVIIMRCSIGASSMCNLHSAPTPVPMQF